MRQSSTRCCRWLREWRLWNPLPILFPGERFVSSRYFHLHRRRKVTVQPPPATGGLN